MTLVNDLIHADRYVLAGLSAFDKITSRQLEQFGRDLIDAGKSEAEAAEAVAAHRARLRVSRGELHQKLWVKSLAAVLLVTSAPFEDGAAPDGGV